MSLVANPVRLGMIGCGLISNAHGRAALKSSSKIQFVACASRRVEASKAWAEAYGCDNYYVDYEEMLRKETLDGVVIATVPLAHRIQIEAALAAGVRHILCEKALTISGADALFIFNTAKEYSATIVEGFMYRHHDAMAKASAIVEAGELGRVDALHGVFHMFDAEDGDASDPGRSWRRRADAGGGVVHDFICYPVDAANRFAGAWPHSVYATGSVSEKFGVINRMFAQIMYENGCVATVASSRKSSLRQSFQIAGANAILDIPTAWSIPGDVTLVKTESPHFLGQVGTEYPIPSEAGGDQALVDLPVFRRQLENFAGVIRGVESPVMPLTSSVLNAFVLEAMQDSFRSGAPATVQIPSALRNASND